MPIEADDVDEDFLSQIEAAEFQALEQKRRKLSNGGGGGTTPEQQQQQQSSSSEGSYTAALKGSRSLVWQQSLTTSPRTASNRSSVVVVVTDSGTGSGDACFKCGELGHWSRDCVSTGGGGGGSGFGGNENVEEKACKCGLGVCSVFTANTERNRGRKFYRCPAREENGGCGFFEWCDNSSATTVSNAAHSATPKSSFPDVPCPCGAGLCIVLTAKTEKNMGQQFYRCPANQENSCGFFKWCIERNTTVSPQANTPTSFNNTNSSNNNKGYGESRGSSCYKCGKDGHWSRDCTETSSPGVRGKSESSASGECYKCGMSGHWARDCQNQKPSSGSSFGAAGKPASSGTCYKCNKSGHWANNCPDQKAGGWR